MISAEEQHWDEATLNELKEKHNIIFMTSSNAVFAFKIIERNETFFGHLIDSPIIAVGSEDDGTLYFNKNKGVFKNRFDSSWIDSIIADLQKVKEIVDKN
jgi:hypothetical protein